MERPQERAGGSALVGVVDGMRTIVDQYLRYLSGHRTSISPYTLRNYRADIDAFLGFLTEREVDSIREVDESTLLVYVVWLQYHGLAPASIDRRMSTLRGFFQYLLGRGLTEIDPISIPIGLGVARSVPRTLTAAEELAILQEPNVSLQGLRDRAILHLLCNAGLKVGELVALDINDIDIHGREPTVRCSGCMARTVPLPRESVGVLRAYVETGRPEMEVDKNEKALLINRFGNRIASRRIQHIVKRYARDSGVLRKVHPQMLRDTFAAKKLSEGCDLEVVQLLLGYAMEFNIAQRFCITSRLEDGHGSVYPTGRRERTIVRRKRAVA